MVKLIIDCGATTCRYTLLSRTIEREEKETHGFSPVVHSWEDFPRFDVLADVDEVYFYGTAMKDDFVGQAQKRIALQFPKSYIDVNTDLVAAARALSGNRKGNIHILGTGSASAFWDGIELHYPKLNLGYLWEDFASGYDIGKTIIQYWADSLLDKEESSMLKKELGDLTAFVFGVYTQKNPKNKLASIAPLIHKLKQKTKDSIIEERLSLYFDKKVRTIKNSAAHHFLGSMADLFKNQLNNLVEDHGMIIGRIMKHSLPGLVEWHKSEPGKNH